MSRLLYTDTSLRCAGRIPSYELDLAYGRDENDFELTCSLDVEMERGCCVWLPGTSIGGMVRGISVKREGGVSWWVYSGPTWTGLLAERVIRPSPGTDYYTVTGDLNTCIGALIARLGLGSIFSPSPSPAGATVTNYAFDRYCDGYSGMAKLLRSKGYRLKAERQGQGKTMLSAVPALTFSDRGKWGFSVERTQPPNHLVCLGAGELKDRIVIDLFADSKGNVSQTQTIFGLDEICEVYDTTQERADLLEDGTKRLKELQEPLSMEVELPDGGEWDVGDSVSVADAKTGVTATAEIIKAVVSAGAFWPEPTVIYQCGEPSLKEA